jgi:predicted RNA-binding Zn-ribbon protein involved in translation (DUF1610 family)
MTIEEMHTDGNAIAGLLEELFGADMTDVDRTCQSCHRHFAIGEHRLYESAGYVLRCPGCGDVAARIAELPDQHVVGLHGAWMMPRVG